MKARLSTVRKSSEFDTFKKFVDPCRFGCYLIGKQVKLFGDC